MEQLTFFLKRKYSIITLMLFIINSNSIGQTLNIEQKAFDFLIEKIDSIQFFYGETSIKFNSKKNTVFLSPTTWCAENSKMYLHQFDRFKKFNWSKKEKFLDYANDSNNYKGIHCDTTKQQISSNKEFVKIIAKIPFYPAKDPDIGVYIINHFTYKDYYYVRIIITVSTDWYSNELWLKIDKKGNVFDYLKDGGVY